MQPNNNYQYPVDEFNEFVPKASSNNQKAENQVGLNDKKLGSSDILFDYNKQQSNRISSNGNFSSDVNDKISYNYPKYAVDLMVKQNELKSQNIYLNHQINDFQNSSKNSNFSMYQNPSDLLQKSFNAMRGNEIHDDNSIQYPVNDAQMKSDLFFKNSKYNPNPQYFATSENPNHYMQTLNFSNKFQFANDYKYKSFMPKNFAVVNPKEFNYDKMQQNPDFKSNLDHQKNSMISGMQNMRLDGIQQYYNSNLNLKKIAATNPKIAPNFDYKYQNIIKSNEVYNNQSNPIQMNENKNEYLRKLGIGITKNAKYPSNYPYFMHKKNFEDFHRSNFMRSHSEKINVSRVKSDNSNRYAPNSNIDESRNSEKSSYVENNYPLLKKLPLSKSNFQNNLYNETDQNFSDKTFDQKSLNSMYYLQKKFADDSLRMKINYMQSDKIDLDMGKNFNEKMRNDTKSSLSFLNNPDQQNQQSYVMNKYNKMFQNPKNLNYSSKFSSNANSLNNDSVISENQSEITKNEFVDSNNNYARLNKLEFNDIEPLKSNTNLSNESSLYPSNEKETQNKNLKSQSSNTDITNQIKKISNEDNSAQMFVSAARKLTIRENPVPSYSSYVHIYRFFWEWTKSTIVQFNTLREIAFITLVELWSRLIPINIINAHKLLDEFGVDHFANHHTELVEMKSIKSISDVRDAPFVSTILRGGKFVLRMDFLPRKLLTTRLTVENDTVILDLLQKRAQLDSPHESIDEENVAVLATTLNKPPFSMEYSGLVLTPSLSLLAGLHPPDFNLNLECIKGIFNPEPASILIKPSLSKLYRLPFNNKDFPAIAWRLENEVYRRCYNYIARDDISRTNLPSILHYEIEPYHLSDQSSSKNKGLEKSMLNVNFSNSGDRMSIIDATHSCIWINDLQTEVLNRNFNRYNEEIFLPWWERRLNSFKEDPISDNNTNDKFDVKFNKSKSNFVLPGNSEGYSKFEFLPPFISGNQLNLGISSGYDGKTHIWDITNSSILYTYKVASPVYNLDVDHFGYLFLTGHHNRVACLWSMDIGSPIRVLTRHFGPVSNVTFHPNSILLATCVSLEGKIRLWDPRVPDIVGCVNSIKKVRNAIFSPNGRYLVYYNFSNIIYVWDIIEGKKLKALNIGSNDVYPVSISFSNNSNLIAVGTSKNHIQLWDLDNINSSVDSLKRKIVIESMDDSNKSYRSLNLKNHLMIESYELNNEIVKIAFTERNVLLVATI